MTIAHTIIHTAVEANLAQGYSLIVSATYSRHSSQDFLSAAVKKNDGNLKVIWCQYSDTPEEIGRRIQDRLERSTVGGVRSVEHYLYDKGRYAGVKLPHIVVMMEGGEEGLNKALAEALKYIDDNE